MQVQTYRCDICGRKADANDYDAPNNWYSLSKQTKDKKNFLYRQKDICPECAEKSDLLRSIAWLREAVRRNN